MSSQEAPIRKREYLTPHNLLGQFVLSARNFSGLGIPVMSSLAGKLSESKSFSLTTTENTTYKQVFSFFFFSSCQILQDTGLGDFSMILCWDLAEKEQTEGLRPSKAG